MSLLAVFAGPAARRNPLAHPRTSLAGRGGHGRGRAHRHCRSGIALVRRRNLRRWVLGAANVIQTIPSLALFGFLIPVPLLGGIGASTAIVALALYALLPDPAQHLHGHCGRGSCGARIRSRHGHDPAPNSLASRVAALDGRDPRGRARRPRSFPLAWPPSPPPSAPAAWAFSSFAAWPWSVTP